LPVLIQYVQIRVVLTDPNDAVVLTDQEDSVAWRWSSSGESSARSAYAAMFVSQRGLQGAKELWKTKAPPEHKFFLWLAVHDRYGAGPTTGDIDMASQATLLVPYARNTLKTSTTSSYGVFSVARPDISC
jgi:hypothetical protein